MFARMPMLQAMGMGLGLGLMAQACSSSESMVGDSGYHPTFDAGVADGGGHDGGGVDSGFDAGQPADTLIRRLSVGISNAQGNGDSDYPSISSDGRISVFRSMATNLVAGDTNGAADVFVHDADMGTTRRVSVGPSGVQGNDYSGQAFVSGNGRFVSFTTGASNLVPPFDTGGIFNVIVRDLEASVNHYASVGYAGVPANSESGSSLVYQKSPVSYDGRFVAFPSDATNIVNPDPINLSDIYVRDLTSTAATQRVSIVPTDTAETLNYEVSMSSDGRYVSFTSFSGAEYRVYVRDRSAGTTELVSANSSASPIEGGNSSISADGRYVAFHSGSQIYLRDRTAGTTTLIAEGGFPSISGNGRFIAFSSNSPSLVSGDTNSSMDVFVYDRSTGSIRRASVGEGGIQANGSSDAPFISGDGRYVVFHSGASNLVTGDTNGRVDVFRVSVERLFNP